MNDEQELQQILKRIESKYGSWEDPMFHFVKEALDSGEWDGLIERVRALAETEDLTDPNTEACRTLAVLKDGTHHATLQLSFVGPYGVFYRRKAGPLGDIFIVDDESTTGELERTIVRLCKEGAVLLLGKEILNIPLRLTLFDSAPERVRVYQALFTDGDYLPGEYEAESGDQPEKA